MKTAEQIYNENQDLNYGDRTFNTPEQWHILAMKQYAKQVAEQALKDASENATQKIELVSGIEDWFIDKQSILNTEIKLP